MLKISLSKILFYIAKSPIGEYIVGIGFGNFSALLPIDKVYETEHIIAFWHPKPFWEKHILIVPKKPIKSLLDINESNQKYISEMYLAVKEIVLKLNWQNNGYSTLINGGTRQDIPQLHMHLFCGSEK